MHYFQNVLSGLQINAKSRGLYTRLQFNVNLLVFRKPSVREYLFSKEVMKMNACAFGCAFTCVGVFVCVLRYAFVWVCVKNDKDLQQNFFLFDLVSLFTFIYTQTTTCVHHSPDAHFVEVNVISLCCLRLQEDSASLAELSMLVVVSGRLSLKNGCCRTSWGLMRWLWSRCSIFLIRSSSRRWSRRCAWSSSHISS